jgi:hypothetical protein
VDWFEMTVAKLVEETAQAPLPENDRQWFPKLIREMAGFVHYPAGEAVALPRERVLDYLKLIQRRGRKAWQRLQAVRAVEFYSDRVLKTDEPKLDDIRAKLEQAARREREEAGAGAEHGGRKRASEDDRPVGVIDPCEPELIKALRRELRLLHYFEADRKSLCRVGATVPATTPSGNPR